MRRFFAFPELAKWMMEVLPELASDRQVEDTPQQQVDALTAVFCSGETLMYLWQFRSLSHIRDGIWELKTPDIRIFGWFPQRDTFIGADVGEKWRIKQHNLYHGHVNIVEHRRTILDLDDPKFIPGDDPNDVVSNYAFPP
jgi:hypothetical protein